MIVHRREREARFVVFACAPTFFGVVVSGIVFTLLVVNLVTVVPRHGRGEARHAAALAILGQVKAALTQYHARHGVHPPSLDELTAGPAPLLVRVPTDPWRRLLIYEMPAMEEGRPYSLASPGQDGDPCTADDISVWAADGAE